MPLVRPAARRVALLGSAALLASGTGIGVAMTSAPASAATHPTISREAYGTAPSGAAVDRYTLSSRGLTVRILTYGGIVQSVQFPDRRGKVGDVVLGFPTLAGYVKGNSPGPYFGALIGRYANRIAGGKFTLDGADYQVPTNDGPNALHGGTNGFDSKVWKATPQQSKTAVGLRLDYTSPAGEEGFPGNLKVRVTYTVTQQHELRVRYQATTDAPTVVNLTNHSYWNLAGGGSIEDHRLLLNASQYTPVDKTSIPTGVLAPVKGTPFDFRHGEAIGSRIRTVTPQLRYTKGYDHNWVIDRHGETGLVLAAQVRDPASGRVLRIRTTEPGVQFYSGNFLDGTLTGKGGRTYRQGDGLALETQHFPDSPNQKSFPSTVLRPGQKYDQSTVFHLYTE